MADDLIRCLERFRSRRVLVLGGFVLDQQGYGVAEDISPEAPVPVLRLTEESHRVGEAGHVAATLATLGAEVVCCGAVGDDEPGRHVVELLDRAGVQTTGLKRVANRRTTTRTRLIGLAQHRHPQQMMRVERDCPDALPPRAVDDIVGAVRDLAEQVEAICICDSETTDWSEALCRAAIDAGRQADRPVLINPTSGGDWQRYRAATVLSANRRKLSVLTGRPMTHVPDVAALAKPWVGELGLRGLVVTLDRDGALVVPSDGEPVHVPTRARLVYDITGAGDVMLAVLSAAVAGGLPLVDAVRLANVAAGLSVERFGPVTVSPEELMAALSLGVGAGVGKLRSLDDLIAELAPRRAAGSKVVFTNGCFDMLHAGHIEYFRSCRAQGDVVVVGLNSDASVQAQGKGDGRPINNQLDRARMLGALEDVDYVTIFEEPTPENMIRRLLPDVLVKGQDWASWVCGRDIVEANGGKVILVPMLEGYSTTQLVERIRGMEERRERND